MNQSFAKRWGIIPPIALFTFFPLTYSIAKLGFAFGPPLLFVGLRMVFSGLLLLGFYFTYSKPSQAFNKNDWFLFFHASITGISLAYIAEYWALKYISVAKVTIIFLCVPFVSVVFEHFHGLEKLTTKKLLGLIIGLCGILPVLLHESGTETFLSLSWYELAMIFAAATYGYGWVAVKRLAQKGHHSILYINGLRMFVGGCCALLASPVLDEWNGIKPAVSDWFNFLWYVFLISVVAVACYTFYGFLIKHYSVGMVSFCGFTEPLFAILYAWILLGETVSWIFFLSLGIVFVGLYLFYQEELRLSLEL
jgi:drug/metabolite transporter (DMT)-like permease